MVLLDKRCRQKCVRRGSTFLYCCLLYEDTRRIALWVKLERSIGISRNKRPVELKRRLSVMCPMIYMTSRSCIVLTTVDHSICVENWGGAFFILTFERRSNIVQNRPESVFLHRTILLAQLSPLSFHIADPHLLRRGPP